MKPKSRALRLLAALSTAGLLTFTFASTALAYTPSLSLQNNNDGDTVTVNITNGDPNSSVLFFYNKTNAGAQITPIGNTNSQGALSTSLSSTELGIAAGVEAYVTTAGIGGAQSNQVAWPTVSSSGNGSFSLTPTSVVINQGQSSTITANISTGSLYLSNNSNPPIATANISGNQITVNALNYGSTVLTICSTATGSTCSSAYVTVQSGGSSSSSLTFSQSNLTIAYGQTAQISISGGTGSYTILNNSNSSVIQSSLNANTLSLYAAATSGTSAITVCSSNQTGCGIINATAGSTTTSGITFSQNSPVLTVGQNLNVVLSGDPNNSYYISTNSNTSVLQASISSNNLNLFGEASGSSSLTICSNSGSCGTLNVTVEFASSGGTFSLSQTSISLLVGQVLTVTASGGTAPYSLGSNSGSIFQASISGNIVSISGISAGSSTLTVCSAGGACSLVSITVNASGVGTPVSFSQNNLAVSVGGITAVTLNGSGGYYVSTSSNSGVANVQVSGTSAVVTGLAVGNTNVSICESGGSCGLLFVSVSGSGTTNSALTFSSANPTVSIGQSITETIYGAASNNFYVSTNTNPSVATLNLTNGTLSVTGTATGNTVVVICTSSSNCGSLNVTVSPSANSAVYFTTTSLPAAIAGTSYSAQLAASGGSGNYTFSIGSGNLPAGLSLSSAGLISGVASTSGVSNASLTVTDTSTNTPTTANFSFTVNPAAATTPAPAPTTSGVLANGELIDENGTIYIVYLNTKVGFASADAFTGLGYSFANVTSTDESTLVVSSKVVVTADGAHPRGTWLIDDNGAVYFLTPGGLIPVPDWNTFLNNGGQGSFIVPANSYDLSFNTLPIMTLNDARLQGTSPN